MKKEKIIIVSFLALITGVGSVIATECYGTTKDNSPQNTSCNSPNPCTYTCEAPTYQVCATSNKPTGNTCSEGPNKNSGIYLSTYVNGTCAGYQPAVPPNTPEVNGSCTGGTADTSALEDPQPDMANLSGC